MVLFAQELKYETKEKDIYLYDSTSHLLYNKDNKINSWNTDCGINTNEKVTSFYPLLRNSLSEKHIQELAYKKAILIIGLSIDATGCTKEVFFVLNPIMEEYLNKNKDFIDEIDTFENLLINKQIKVLTDLKKQGHYKVFAGIRFHLLYNWILEQANLSND